MNNTLLRSILAGLLVGAALFIMPFFLLRLIVFLLIVSALFRLFGGGRFRRGGWGRSRGFGYMPAFADRIRQMSDDEYAAFRQRYDYDHCGVNPGRKAPESPSDQTSTTI
ncbi:hypothetical protein [Spirosoma koreense]